MPAPDRSRFGVAWPSRFPQPRRQARPCGFSPSNASGAVRRVATEKYSRSLVNSSGYEAPFERTCGQSVEASTVPSAECTSIMRSSCVRLTCHVGLRHSVRRPSRVMRRGILLSTRRSATRSSHGQRGLTERTRPHCVPPSGAHGVQNSLRRFAPGGRWPMRFRAGRARVPFASESSPVVFTGCFAWRMVLL